MADYRMTDMERILLKVVCALARELYRLQSTAWVREWYKQFNEIPRVSVRWSDGPDLKPGELVMCQTASISQVNPWIVSFAHEPLPNGSNDGYALRAIGRKDICNYSNESFMVIDCDPEILWEKDKYEFSLKVRKAKAKIDSYCTRYRGIDFPEPGVAMVTFGEVFGGMGKPSKPYQIRIKWTPDMTVAAIYKELVKAKVGERKFEPAETTDDTKGNPQPITRDKITEVIQASIVAPD